MQELQHDETVRKIGKVEGRAPFATLERSEYVFIQYALAFFGEIPSPSDIRKIQGVLRPTLPHENRDRAVLELLYFCGISLIEICRLRLDEIDFSGRVIMIQSAEGKRKLIPFGGITAHILQEYLAQDRKRLLRGKKSGFVFVGRHSGFFSPFVFHRQWKKYLSRTDLDRKISLRSLRGGYLIHLLSHLHFEKQASPEETGALLSLIETISD